MKDVMFLFIGSILTIIGGILQFHYMESKKNKEFEKNEKIKILKELLAYKSVLITDNMGNLDSLAVTKFLAAFNLIPMVFKNKDVLEKYNKFTVAESQYKDDILYELFVELFNEVGLTPPERKILFKSFYLS